MTTCTNEITTFRLSVAHTCIESNMFWKGGQLLTGCPTRGQGPPEPCSARHQELDNQLCSMYEASLKAHGCLSVIRRLRAKRMMIVPTLVWADSVNRVCHNADLFKPRAHTARACGAATCLRHRSTHSATGQRRIGPSLCPKIEGDVGSANWIDQALNRDFFHRC